MENIKPIRIGIMGDASIKNKLCKKLEEAIFIDSIYAEHVLVEKDKTHIRQYIARSVGFASSVQNLKKLFPTNYHFAVDNFVIMSGNPYKYSYRHIPTEAELKNFKRNNRTSLKIIKTVIVRKMLST